MIENFKIKEQQSQCDFQPSSSQHELGQKESWDEDGVDEDQKFTFWHFLDD